MSIMKTRGIRSLAKTVLYVFCAFVFYLLYKELTLTLDRPNIAFIENNNVYIYSSKTHSFVSEQQARNKSDVVDFRVIIIVYARSKSLLRLLHSVNAALYYGDKIAVDVWIDKSMEDIIDEETLETASAFKFKHGEYNIYTHQKHVGIYGQWLSTWNPKPESREIAVILEDDLTVSPYYYKYLKLVHGKYGQYRHINGFTLQGASMKHNGDRGLVEGPGDTIVFLYPTLGTWGFSPNRRNWMDFVEWFSSSYNDTHFQPYVPGHVSTKWYKSFQRKGKVNGMWSMWHIYFAWKNKEVTLYPNFKGHLGLTINYKEVGLHYDGNKASQDRLLTEWKPEYDRLPPIPPHLDNGGNVMT